MTESAERAAKADEPVGLPIGVSRAFNGNVDNDQLSRNSRPGMRSPENIAAPGEPIAPDSGTSEFGSGDLPGREPNLDDMPDLESDSDLPELEHASRP